MLETWPLLVCCLIALQQAQRQQLLLLLHFVQDAQAPLALLSWARHVLSWAP
jgi:hypothetical protein